MFRRRDRESESVFRLDRRIAYPLALLLAMPLVSVARALLTQGLNGRNLLSLGLAGLVLLLFLPWLTRKVVVSQRGILSSMLFGRRFLSWGEVTKVAGYDFRGRAIVMLEGGGKRILVTDVIGQFRHLVSYCIEHASGAVIDADVPSLITHRGRTSRDALILWIAVAAMGFLMALKFFWR